MLYFIKPVRKNDPVTNCEWCKKDATYVVSGPNTSFADYACDFHAGTIAADWVKEIIALKRAGETIKGFDPKKIKLTIKL